MRVSCTAALGVRHVCRALFAFQDRDPGIRVDLGLCDVAIDLVREATGIAIRSGPLEDSALQRRADRPVAPPPRGVARRPRRPGRPDRPDDLLRPEAIRMSTVAGSETLVLRGPDGARTSLPFDGRMRIDHGLAAREAVAEGRGIAASHVWLVQDLLATGALEVVLPGFTPDPVPNSILIVPGRTRIRRVRLLVDEIAAALAALPGIDPA